MCIIRENLTGHGAFMPRMTISGFRRVKIENGRAYLRQGFRGLTVTEKRIQSIKPSPGTKTRVIKVSHGKLSAKCNISETTIKKARFGFKTLVRMHAEHVPHVLFPLGFKVDRKLGKGYLFTLHEPGYSLGSAKYKRLGRKQKQAVASAVIESMKQIHEKGWILRDRNPTNILFNFTKSGRVKILHIDPFTAVKFRGKKEHREELMKREMRYVFDMLSRLG